MKRKEASRVRIQKIQNPISFSIDDRENEKSQRHVLDGLASEPV